MGLILSILVFLLLFLSLKYFEHKNIYLPERDSIANPLDFGIDFEEINFSSRDHVLINGWFIQGPKDKVILLCHGNGGNISYRVDLIEILNYLGYKIFVFDYRGYGKSDGIPTERGLYRDALGAYDILKEKGFKNEDIVLLGRSLGGAVAIFLASRVKPSGLIVDSSFESIHILSKDVLGFYFPRWLISNRFESIQRIKNIKIPKLVIHSIDDEIIPFYHGKNLYEAAPEPKRFLRLHGSHNTSLFESKDIYIKELRNFIDNL